MEKEQNVIPVNLDFNAKIHNRFDIEVHDAKTGEVKQRAQAFNVICDALWTRLLSGNAYFVYIIYGSGTGTPAATDTALFNKINAIYVTGDTYSVNDDNLTSAVVSMRKQITIGTEVSNGSTIREVGIGYDDTHIVTHAMLQDMNGNPISITKTNVDVITIYATIYIHYVASDLTKSQVTAASIFYGMYRDPNDTVIRNSELLFRKLLGVESSFDYRIEVRNSNLFYDGGQRVELTLGYDSSGKTISVSGRINTNQFNNSRGILGILLFNSISLDARQKFTLNNFAITGESIGSGDGSTINFNTTFPINSSAKVYIDGVEQLSGVTINTGVDREFYKLLKIYDGNHHLINFEGHVLPHSSWAMPRSGFFIIENDSGITFNGIDCDNNRNRIELSGSDDFNSWDTISINWQSYTGTFTPNNYRYYKFSYSAGDGVLIYSKILLLSPNDKTYDVIFDTPPASGSVITIDYVPDCIPKDSNHVLDLTLSLTLGEYSGN